MADHWSMLGLEEPTRDISAVKRAYARKSREYHPEEDPRSEEHTSELQSH